jgi:hypothetical protein
MVTMRRQADFFAQFVTIPPVLLAFVAKHSPPTARQRKLK